MKRILIAGFTFGVAAIAVAKDAPPTRPASSLGAGYLGATNLPDPLVMVPPLHAPNSAAQARDEDSQKAALALRGTPRWDVATSDAELFKPEATAALSCAAGIAISPTATPKLDRLLRMSAADLGLSTGAVKRKYQRPRPFMVNGQPSCTPAWEAMLKRDGSYPSGHSAIGYGWGLILAELIPGRAAQLVARGRAFGDSRRVCNVHWLSDTEEGRVPAAAVVAALHSNAAFQRDLKAARAEIARAGPPTRDCAKEAAALAL